MKEYHNHIPISVPVEDWDDRNALYAMWVPLASKIRSSPLSDISHFGVLSCADS